MEKTEEGRYRCRKLGLGRIGNPDRDLAVIYDRPVPESTLRMLPKDLVGLIKSLSHNQRYSIICDSDGDFLITNEKNRSILPDLFCEMKRRKVIE